MLHETIRNDDFYRNTELQHCCDIVSNGYNIVPKLQRCAALKIVVANRSVKREIRHFHVEVVQWWLKNVEKTIKGMLHEMIQINNFALAC